MATLILSSVGSAVAGPAGAAVGGYFGRQIDRQFRQPGVTRKLSDLRIQSSQYGSDIPAIYGRMRVAGTVIWASELMEAARVSKSGAQHSYSVSFAVALSSRPLLTVGRIWADGRLIRGAAGDHKIPFSMRLLAGGEDQQPDPLIASIEGTARTPAFRGVSLIMFEDFDLSTFGNRLPQITVEVEAAGAGVGASALLGSILQVPADGEGSEPPVGGYALQGDDCSDSIAPLLECFDLPFRTAQAGWVVGGQPDHHLFAEDEVAGRLLEEEQEFGGLAAAPSKVSIRYFEATMDFAAGEKAARLPGPERVRRIEFPGVLTSDDAKSIAHRQLAAAWLGRRRLRLLLPAASAREIRLGDTVEISGRQAAPLRVRAMRLKEGTMELFLSETARLPTSTATDSGSIRKEIDQVPDPVRLALVELPDASGAGLPKVAVAVAGGARPWRRAAVELTIGGAVQQLASADLPSVLGNLTSPLGAAPPELIDERNVLIVQLSDDHWLLSVDDAELLAGANLACVGGELLQFGTAVALGGGAYRLSRLVRGRSGTDPTAGHDQGATFVLMAPDQLAPVHIPAEMIGSQVTARIIDRDGLPVEAGHRFEASAALPLSPVHLSCNLSGAGLELSWIRRSRAGAAWLDFVDCPVGESIERYAVVVTDVTGSSVHFVSATTALTLSAAEISILGPRPWQVTVRQIGDFGVSGACLQTIA